MSVPLQVQCEHIRREGRERSFECFTPALQGLRLFPESVRHLLMHSTIAVRLDSGRGDPGCETQLLCLHVQSFMSSSPLHHFSYRCLSVLMCLQAPVSSSSYFGWALYFQLPRDWLKMSINSLRSFCGWDLRCLEDLYYCGSSIKEPYITKSLLQKMLRIPWAYKL